MLQKHIIGAKTSPISFQSVETSSLSWESLDRIFEIEQDMWARGIGEYIRCISCETMYSKADIFWNHGSIKIPDSIRLDTVMQIEKFFWGNTPLCICCGWETRHVYEKQQYMWAIERRYNRNESFLTLAYGRDKEIIGFMDGYLTTLWEIFQEELRFHYSEKILDELEQRYLIQRDQKLLTFSSIGTDDRNKSLITIFGLLQTFFRNMDSQYNHTLSIFESIIGSSTYCIFNIMGARPIQAHKNPDFLLPGSQNHKYPTDILLHFDMVSDYKEKFTIRVRDIVQYSRDFHKTQDIENQ